jgi:hypothetical protein
MTADRVARGSAIAPLLYWLLVVGGLLAAYRVLEHGEQSTAGALWAGAVLGTAIGQGAAWKRLPIWALVLFVPVLMVAVIQLGFVLCLTVGLCEHSADPWTELEIGVMAFIPAVACGYASLSERGGLLAFWFPTSLWALAILDGTERAAFASAWSWVLLSVLAGLFVAFLAAREARRVALWQRHAVLRLSTARGAAVLRRSPTRSAAQAAWTVATAGATLLLTSWIAPHLWQNEQTGPLGHGVSSQLAAGAGGGAPCCPEAPDTAGESHRVREYFPLLHPHGDALAPVSVVCVACVGGVPTGPAPVNLSPMGVADGGGTVAATQVAAGAPGVQGDGSQGSSTAPVPFPLSVPPTPAAPPPAPLPVVAHAEPPHPGPAPHGTPAPAVPHSPPHAGSVEISPLPWLLALAVSALLVQLALRPLRRLVTLRHLRASLWPEPIDQRVSNLWQLVLVGLRDAGWHAAPGEQPLALARRAGLPGAETCAMVLERTRHGVRVEATDLDGMVAASRTAFRAARQRVGSIARALSWLRWPLV